MASGTATRSRSTTSGKTATRTAKTAPTPEPTPTPTRPGRTTSARRSASSSPRRTTPEGASPRRPPRPRPCCRPAPSNTGLPLINGNPQQGQTLTATNGKWDGGPTTFDYQWQDCDQNGQNCTDTGDDVTTYTLTSDDVGSAIEVTVTATNDGGRVPELNPPDRRPSPAPAVQQRTAPDQRHRPAGPDADDDERRLGRQPDHVRLPVAGLRSERPELHQHRNRRQHLHARPERRRPYRPGTRHGDEYHRPIDAGRVESDCCGATCAHAALRRRHRTRHRPRRHRPPRS